MNKYATIVAAMLLLSTFAVVEAGSASQGREIAKQAIHIQSVPAQGKEIAKQAIRIQSVPARELQAMNFTKLEISPSYGNIRLQPGESKEINVTIKNKDNKTVSVRPNIVTMPGEYILDSAWITVTPESAEIPVGGSMKFTINASVPDDATVGYYSAEIAFTDEEMPTPYPQPVPYYIHALQLSVEVWSSPKVQILTPYINDQLEAGKEYNFEIKLKNTGDTAVGIDPKIGSDAYYYSGPYGMMSPVSMEDGMTITAPASIQAGSTGIVKIHVRVPSDATGSYNGYIDLGIDDPSVREWEGRVSLYFSIWNQPTEPFIRSFNLTKAAPITIEISSSYYTSSYGNGQGATSREPSFEITLEDPRGVITRLNLTKRLIKGSVYLGGDIMPPGTNSESMYQENGVQYIETYKANGQPGTWKLRVLPGNTQGFEYGITIGE